MLKFIIPTLPASMNQIYNIIYGLRKIELKPEVRLWKNDAKQYIPPWSYPDESLFWISLEFHGNWRVRSGKIKKVDHANMEKVVIDVVAEKLGFDDSRIFEKRMSRKVQSTDERVEIQIGVMDEQ